MSMKNLIEDRDVFISTLENMSDGYLSLDVDGTILYMNQKACDLFSRDPATLITKNIWTQFPEWVGHSFHCALKKTLKEQKHFEIQECYPPYQKWYANRFYPTATGVEVFFTDITDRILSEKVLGESERSKASILSSLPGMAYRCSMDRNWTMQFVSQGCYKLTGYRPESLLYNREVAYGDLIAPEFREELWEKCTNIDRDQCQFSYEYRLIRATGESIWVTEKGQYVFNQQGQIEALEGLILDISDRKKSEQDADYLLKHDYQTGIFNRNYFNKEKNRLDTEEYLPLSIIFADINGLKSVNNALGHDFGDLMIKTTAQKLASNCRAEDILFRLGGDEFGILLPNTDQLSANRILIQIKESCALYNGSVKNEMAKINLSLGCATKDIIEVSMEAVVQLAEENMYRRKLLERKSLHSAFVSSMQTALFARSQGTEEHAERLAQLTKIVGMRLHLPPLELNELELLATLHDIGKVGITDLILNKPGKLTPEEWTEMQKHSEIGYRIAVSSPELRPIADYILTHHERWDGKGYPRGLSGESIPLISRILAVADAYDAMTQDRSYRKAMSRSDALDEIELNSGTQFDPNVARVFLDLLTDNDDEITASSVISLASAK
jgi:diguanylate cyclase (GGDEF)-like protein/PAS domain S-box-containing protein